MLSLLLFAGVSEYMLYSSLIPEYTLYFVL